MTDRELLQMALDALELTGVEYLTSKEIEHLDALEIALRARLAQPEPKPITMVVSKTGDPSVTMSWWHEPALPVGTPLYTAPPKKEWVGLIDEELLDIADMAYANDLELLQTLQAKLKEKNTKGE